MSAETRKRGQDFDTKASEEFTDLLMIGGTTAGACPFCNRLHFSTSFQNDKEKSELLALKKLDPEGYYETGDDSVALGEMNGDTVILGCPCNILARYEDFIWRNRKMILAYLQGRMNRNAQAAAAEVDMLKGLADG